MAIEGPPKGESPLDKALRDLEASRRESERNIRRFETETGFGASLRFFTARTVNLTLEKGGQYSTFEVTPEGVRFNDLRGVDGETLTEPSLQQQHTNEAQRLFIAGELERHEIDDNNQYNLDL